MKREQNQSFYYPQLDGLRFFAFLLVFIHNAPHIDSVWIWKLIHEYGWVGVDIFFCLSAYLITKQLKSEYTKNNTIIVSNFYFRRTLRIIPLYSFYLLLGTIYITFNTNWERNLTNHLIALVSFTYNIAYPYLMYKNFIVFVHLWTISFEWQFYAVIPWILKKFVSKKYQIINYLILLFLGGIVIRGLLIFLKVKHPVIYMLPLTHFESIFFGVLVGIEAFDKITEKILPEILFFAGILSGTLIFLLPNTFEIGWGLMLTYPLAGISACLILRSLIYSSNNIIKIFFQLNIFVYLGKISFGLYIYHVIALIIADFLFKKFLVSISSINTYLVVVMVFGLIITIIFASISYQVIEKPFLSLKQKFRNVNSYRI